MNTTASPVEVSPVLADLEASYVVVPPSQLPEFRKRLEKLNAKAERFGLPPITVLSDELTAYERRVEAAGRDGDRLMVTMVRLPEGVTPKGEVVLLNRIKIEYPQIKLGNWQVVARLEAFEESNLLFTVTGREDDATVARGAALKPICCEHCNVKRKRKESFVLRDLESGEYKQVGNTCLEDFTGISPDAALFLAKMYDMVRVTEGELDDFAQSGRANAVGTQAYLSNVSYLIERYGFVSAAKARDEGGSATFADAIGLGMSMAESRELLDAVMAARPANDEKAAAVRAWYAEKASESDFDRNVQMLLGRDYLRIDSRHLALAAAAVAQYNRHHQAERERKAPSEHVGTPGQKMVAQLAIDRVLEIDNPYVYNGRSFILLMSDSDGNKFKWKTGAATADMVKGTGRTMSASFKVGKHEEYKGQKQTTVTHLKLDRWMDETVELQAASLRSQDDDGIDRSNVASVRECIADLIGVGALELQGSIGSIVVTQSSDPRVGAGRVQSWNDAAAGITYFVADRIPAGREASVFLHEIVHRHGRAALPQERFGQLVDQVKAWGDRDGVERAIHDAAQRRVATARVTGAAADEELFAYAVEEAVARGVQPSAAAVTGSAEAWLQAVVESIQRIGEKLIGNDLQGLDGQDLVDLAYALAQLDSPEHGFEVRRALLMAEEPAILSTDRQIVAYMARTAGNSDFDPEFAREYFHGAKGVKRLFPIASLVPGCADANQMDPERQLAYAAMSPETAPPIIVEDGVVMDGGHRLRDAVARGLTYVWGYDIVDQSAPEHELESGHDVEFAV